jgi:hypothetical protein
MREDHLALADLALEKIMTRMKQLDPNEMSVRDLATWADLSVKVARQARGEADKTLKVEGELAVVDKLSATERRTLMAEALSVLNKRLGREQPQIEAYMDAEVIEEDDDGGEEGKQG